jgi:hypothetical protein
VRASVLGRSGLVRPEPARSNLGFSALGLSKRGFAGPDLSNPGFSNRGFAGPDFSNLGLSNRGLSNLGFSKPPGLLKAGLPVRGRSNGGLPALGRVGGLLNVRGPRVSAPRVSAWLGSIGSMRKPPGLIGENSSIGAGTSRRGAAGRLKGGRSLLSGFFQAGLLKAGLLKAGLSEEGLPANGLPAGLAPKVRPAGLEP